MEDPCEAKHMEPAENELFHSPNKQWPAGPVRETGWSRGYIVHDSQRLRQPSVQRLIYQSDKQRLKEWMAAATLEPV